jgi:hypothetical protein
MGEEDRDTDEQEGDAESGSKFVRALKFFFASSGRTGATFGGLAIVAVIVIAIVSSGGGSPVSPPAQTSPLGGPMSQTQTAPAVLDNVHSLADLDQYILSRPFWQGTPRLFEGSIRLAYSDDGSDGDGGTFSLDDGVVDAYSTTDVLSSAASLAGSPIMVVARVENETESAADSQTLYSWGNQIGDLYDVDLIGPHGKGQAYGLLPESSGGDDGLDFIPMVVAAEGQTRTAGQSVYLIAVGDAVSVSEYGPLQGKSIPQVAREFRGK